MRQGLHLPALARHLEPGVPSLSRPRASRLPGVARGFTLVEVMVALVVTSLLVAVLMSALFYMYRVQESLQGELVTREAQLRTRAWFEDALSACLPIKADSGLTNVPFFGEAAEVRCETTQSLRPVLGGAPVPVRLALVRGNEQRMALVYNEYRTGFGVSEGKPFTLVEWEDAEAEFRFIGHDGKESERWPKEGDRGDSQETLPALVMLRFKQKDAPENVWLVGLRNDPWFDPPRRLPFGLGGTQ